MRRIDTAIALVAMMLMLPAIVFVWMMEIIGVIDIRQEAMNE